MSLFLLCPCGSQMLCQECCGRYHDGLLPENALVLMRSRYAAYALGRVDYIMETTHRDSSARVKDQTAWRADLLQFCQGTVFEKLQILEFIDGAKTASVTFTACLKQSGRDATFTEKSAFVKEKGRWLYRDGKFLRPV